MRDTGKSLKSFWRIQMSLPVDLKKKKFLKRFGFWLFVFEVHGCENCPVGDEYFCGNFESVLDDFSNCPILNGKGMILILKPDKWRKENPNVLFELDEEALGVLRRLLGNVKEREGQGSNKGGA